MTISFEGQVAVVTGGGGGIGRIQALELARRGASVVVNDVGGAGTPDGPFADRVVAEIEAEGGTAVASQHSIATPEGGKALVDLAVERYGTVDAILHYAAVWRHVLMEDMTADQLDPVLDVHLRGAFFVVQPAWSIMKEKGYGRVMLTSSSAGAFGRQFGTNYSAAKMGLIGLARALAHEGAEHGILANCLLPIAKVHKPQFEGQKPAAELMNEFAKTGLATGAHPPGSTGELVVSMPTYLASSACTVNGQAYEAGAGHYARVFVAVSDGWLCAAGETPTAEDIAAHLGEIDDTSSFSLPWSVHEQMRAIAEQLAERDGTPVV
jgi:NAD(P)-dependent dehydrogenase (short-subunit alcohol dehydrogenase family)